MTLSNKDYVLETMRRYGAKAAKELQEKSSSMTGTELYESETFIPTFAAACAKKNMMERSAGFTCITSLGHVVRLLQPYDSTVYTDEPESYPALWGFVWSKDPAKARPFVAISTSPYNLGDCCTENGQTYRSKLDGNVWSPESYPTGWEAV